MPPGVVENEAPLSGAIVVGRDERLEAAGASMGSTGSRSVLCPSAKRGSVIGTTAGSSGAALRWVSGGPGTQMAQGDTWQWAANRKAGGLSGS